MLADGISDDKPRQSKLVSYDATPFGQRLRSARKAAGLTQADAASNLGISQSTVSELEKTGQGTTYAVQFAALYKVNAHWLATGESPATEPSPRTWTESQHPNGGADSRGAMAQELSHHQKWNTPPILSWEALLKDPLPELFAVRIQDDAMAPLLRIGHTARFDSRLQARPGDLVLVRDSHDQLFVRSYVQRRPGMWLAVAANSAYHALESADDQLVVLAVFTGMEGRLG